MKKLLFFVAALSCTISASAAVTGSCGTNATYVVDTVAKTLTISGTGATDDYTSTDHAPWYEYRANIKTVTVNSGITSLGEFSFAALSGVSNVSFPTTLTSIGAYAFYSCYGLNDITLPSGVTTLGDDAFNDCKNLLYATLPGVTNAPENVFYRCSSLLNPVYNSNVFFVMPDKYAQRHVSYRIPDGISTICGGAFRGCKLQSVTIPASVTSMSGAFYSAEHIVNADSYLKVVFMESTTPVGGQPFLLNSAEDNYLPIYVPESALYAYQHTTTFGALNVHGGGMQEFLAAQGKLDTLQFRRIHAADGDTVFAEGAKKANLRYRADSLQIMLPTNPLNPEDAIFLTDTMTVRLQCRRNNQSRNVKTWDAKGDDEGWNNVSMLQTVNGFISQMTDATTFDGSNPISLWFRNIKNSYYDFQFRLKILYGRHGDTLTTTPIEAHCYYPVTFKEGAEYQYATVLNNVQSDWQDAPETLYVSAGDTTLYRVKDASTCVKELVSYADIYRMNTTAPADSIVNLKSILLYSGAAFPFCYEINPIESTTTFYGFQDWDGSLISYCEKACGEEPDVPADPVREGHEFTGWKNVKTGEMGVKVCHVTSTYRAVYDGETALSEHATRTDCVKRIENNQLFIYRNGHRYNTLGQQMDK